MESAEFQERIVSQLVSSMGLMLLYTGHKLSIFTKLKELQDMKKKELKDNEQDNRNDSERLGVTIDEVVKASSLHPRYIKEFLAACATHGYLEYHSAQPESASVFYLPPGHAECLTNKDSPHYAAAATAFIPSLAGVLKEDKLFSAYKDGSGVDYSDYGEEVLEAISEGNRPMFIHELASQWLPKLPDIFKQLSEESCRVADIGCGQGFSTIEMARHFPKLNVYGYDLDSASIEKAKVNIDSETDQDLKNRVRFICKAAHEIKFDDEDKYILITLFECLHDMSNPVEILASLRQLLKPEGAILVADEKVPETLKEMVPKFGTEENVFLGKLNYSFSALHCLPAVLAFQPSAGIGTAITASMVEKISNEAGFKCTVIHENDVFRFYRLDLQQIG